MRLCEVSQSNMSTYPGSLKHADLCDTVNTLSLKVERKEGSICNKYSFLSVDGMYVYVTMFLLVCICTESVSACWR